MDIQEFTEHFAEQFEDTDMSAFAPETRFRDLDEWNSFLALSIMAMVGEEYDVALSAAEMRSAQTIRELFDMVQNKL